MAQNIEKYHHYCFALNRGFSPNEWVAFLKEHSTNDVVKEYKGFKYNICDICLNPSIKRFIIPNMICCEIQTAESEGGWSYGYNFAYSQGSALGGAKYKIANAKGVFSSEKKAIESALRQAISYCEYHNIGHSAINEIRRHIADTRQLNLFEA